jgi:hypothetical protein
MIWEGVLKEKLEALGVQVRIAHFTGDSSYPTEYTLIAGDVQAGGEPTLDLAMVAFIKELLPHEPVLVDCPFCSGAHYTGQLCPLAKAGDVQVLLQKLDELEHAADEAAEAIEAAETSEEAVEQWHKLKSAQLAQADIRKSLEAQGYRVMQDLEHMRPGYSVSRGKPG